MLIGHPEWSPNDIMRYFQERAKEEKEGIELCEGIKLRRISVEDLEDLKSVPFMVPSHMISPDLFVLEKYVTDEDKDYHEIHNIMLNSVLALRLLKSGDVMGRSIFRILLLNEKRQLTGRTWEPEPNFELHLGDSYALNHEEIPSLRGLLEQVLHTDFVQNRSFRLACKRFQRTYDQSEAEDKLIDIMIAFEALLLKGKKGDEWKGQKIAKACSDLLGKNDEEREEIKLVLSKAYKLRNLIVHGAEYSQPIVLKDNQMWLDQFVLKMEDYLRRAIKKSLG